jgi:hypothetical protein
LSRWSITSFLFSLCISLLLGIWSELSVCETIRCDAELLRANPRLVTEWGEIKPTEGGALYAPSTIFAIYAFAFGPHCKQCELNFLVIQQQQ